ncbi:hypothetical protein CBR_g50159 [Chara braunii]|uniref:Protein kinase domain-containing protein n=1 Tax=Chara braunii TaxID=69332 RepID=A0A388M6A9_CHABU|nr:hypothetical protein CBR_g50159 [Chara braunii]|eukprot:GBG90066.1 hypothetical protein CBR_g50159 [Chara braunii]
MYVTSTPMSTSNIHQVLGIWVWIARTVVAKASVGRGNLAGTKGRILEPLLSCSPITTVDTRAGKSTSPYTAEEEAKAAAILKERKERKEAKKKALMEEQAAKMKTMEEEMAREKERLKKEEEEKLKAVEEEEEIEEEEPLERRRREQRGESNGTRDDQLEKKITEWVANLSLGEEEEALMYVPREEQEAVVKEWEAEEDPLKRQAMEDETRMEWKLRLMWERKRRMEVVSQAAKELEEVKKHKDQMAIEADLLGKVGIMARNIERLTAAQEEQYQFIRSQDIALRSIRLGFKEFARELVMQVGSEVKARLENTERHCTVTVEGARYLGSTNLYGEIPDMFSNLQFLRILSLQNNHLTGRIPPSLGALAEHGALATVDLQRNNLSGYLPTSLGTLAGVQVSPGNENLCNDEVAGRRKCPPGTDMPPGASTRVAGQESGSSTNQRTLVAIVVSIVVACAILGTLAWWCFHVRHNLNFTPFLRGYSKTGRAPQSGSSEARRFKTKELQVITANWNRVIGRGGFGPVYLGILSDNTKVAIKKLYAQSSQGALEFVSEVDLLRRLHHRCLVNLVGWCDEVEKVLIYEYKENGSLSSMLYNKKGGDAEGKVGELTWKTRLQVILDVARGLDYLHHGAVPPVVHRDIKSDNVLVDHELHASVADFGISKAGTVGEIQATTVVKGTLGYLDPEYQRTHVASLASDVYSFGVLMLEIIAGRRPIDPTRPADEINLQYWALGKLERQEIQAIVDPRLSDYNFVELQGILEIVKDCLRERKLRPTMHEVLHRLEELSAQGLRTSIKVTDDKGKGEEAEEGSPYETRYASSDGLRTRNEYENGHASNGLWVTNEETEAGTGIAITNPEITDMGKFDTRPMPR